MAVITPLSSRTQQQSDRVDQPSAAYDEMARLWTLPRTLMGGTAAMRVAGRDYLPQEIGETPEAYAIRVARSFLFNGFKRTVMSIKGKIFAKPIVVDEDVPEDMVAWCEDIDLCGRNLDSFAADFFEDCFQVGIAHILVDMQQPLKDDAGQPRTVVSQAEVKKAGRRPYFVHVKAENLIGWRSDVIEGVPTLTQIRVREAVTEDEGRFGENVIPQIRVIWRDRFEVHRQKQGSSEWELFDEGRNELGEVPLVTFYTGRTAFMRAEPPLQDLADLNVAHWQSSSDQRHILHVARVPILFRSGFGEADGSAQEIGPNRMFTAANADAKMQYVEHSGAAIGSGRQDLLDLEDRMRVMGLELFLPRPGDVTATARQIDSEEVNSTVRQWALAGKDTMENGLRLMARWKGAGADSDEGGSLVINTDYGISARDATDITALLQMRATGEITRDTFWKEMKRRRVLADDFDAEQEKIGIEDEMPDPTTVDANGNPIEPPDEPPAPANDE
jgi:hypothetical protein